MLAEGERGRVTCLEAPESTGARKLAALGILPGVGVVLLQRTPVFVFRMGHGEFALDAGLAAQVRVRRE
jgi:Fe2+ transport system protein FeoA